MSVEGNSAAAVVDNSETPVIDEDSAPTEFEEGSNSKVVVKTVCAKRSDDEIREEDRLSNLLECLIFEVLLKLTTKDVVKTSVLSKRWKNLWRYVPGLDLSCKVHPCPKAFGTFVNRFLSFNSESCLQNLKLEIDWNAHKSHLVTWINTSVERKVQYLHVLNQPWYHKLKQVYEAKITPRVYTCERLVSLKLSGVTLPIPEFVSLPSLKVIKLDVVKFANDWAFEVLISGCPVLESLAIRRSSHDNVKVLRVCSKSLLSFTHVGFSNGGVVAIDAPILEYLKLYIHETTSFITYNFGSLVKVDYYIVYNPNAINPNDLPQRNMIRNFLVGITNVKDMTISFDTIQVVYDYSTFESVPLFRNLSFLHLNLSDYNKWNLLSVFLERCPNLKSLSLKASFNHLEQEPIFSLVSVPQCLKSSLEYVEIEILCFPETIEMNLVSCFLENSATLKKLTLHLHTEKKKEVSVILNKLHNIPRLSTSCRFELSFFNEWDSFENFWSILF